MSGLKKADWEFSGNLNNVEGIINIIKYFKIQ